MYTEEMKIFTSSHCDLEPDTVTHTELVVLNVVVNFCTFLLFCSDTEAMVVDVETREPLEVGKDLEGELCIRGPQVRGGKRGRHVAGQGVCI